MGEADWWLCTSCSSLNNLAARKCYSCGHGKPKGAVRASEYLGYRPIVSWDGKVKLQQLNAEERGAQAAAGAAAPQEPERLALREPVPRNTLAVAPRPPHPARMTYRLSEPPLASTGPLMRPASDPSIAVPRPRGASGQGVVPARPLMAVGPGPGSVPEPPGELWPHWKELLDGPMPHADQLRNAIGGNTESGTRMGSGSPQGALTLRSAIRLARTGKAREFVPWPEGDRRPEAETDGEAEPASRPGDRSPE